MKNIYLSFLLLFMVTLSFAAAAPHLSALNNDPEVIYLEEHLNHTVELIAASDAVVYGDKKANRRLGVFAENTKVKLLAISEHAYQVKGKAKHAGVTGWVDPKLMASKDKNFIENLKKLYERQIIVKKLITEQDVAIGMTLEEVLKSLGKPTKTEVKQTRKGETGSWDYIVSEEKKHYNTVVDPITKKVFRQLSHVTTEETSRTTLEFENDVVTTITRKRDNGSNTSRIIPLPVRFHF